MRHQELKPVLSGAGLGLLIAALFSFASLRFGGFALPAALALAAFGFPPRAGILGALLGLFLLPVAGIAATAALGAGLALAGRQAGGERADWSAAPAAAAWVCWAELADLLLADPLWALCGLAAAAALASTRLVSMAAAGGLGALGLALVRMAGLNAGAAARLELPAAGWGDVLSLGAPLFIAAFLWLSASGAAGRRGPAVAAGALAGAAASHWLGPAAAALLFHGLQAAWGARRLFAWFQAGPVLVAACFALAWPARQLARDVWQNRLNSAFRGGAWTSFTKGKGTYRFSSGEEVTVENGVAGRRAAATGRRAAHLLALAHPSPQSALLLTDWPGALESLKLHAATAAPGGDPRRRLRACAGLHDLILVSPPPLRRLRRLATRGFMKELKRCLKPGGVAGFLAHEELHGELAGAGRDVFAHVAMAGPLLLFGDAPFSLARPAAAHLIDDPQLERELKLEPAPAAGAPIRTDDRPYGPSVTSRNLYNLRR